MHPLLPLKRSIRLVVLQFNFSNQNVIPSSLGNARDETLEERQARSGLVTGVLITELAKKVSLEGFADKLAVAGYELVSAFCQRRRSQLDKMYYTVRFVFARKEYAKTSDEFKQRRETVFSQLVDFCKTAMWQMEIFLNPFYEKGQEVPGQKSISINLTMREPLFHSDGRSITFWRKTRKGELRDDRSHQLKPRRYLYIKGNVIKLTGGAKKG